MKKKKINKLIVPLTLRSASILSAFTIMATSIVGCASKKETKDDKSDPTPGIYSDINDDLKNNSDIISPSPSEESQIEEKENESSINNEVNNNYNNTTTKPNNTSKPTPGNNSNNNNTTNNNTSSSTPTPGDDGNKSDEKVAITLLEFKPLTPQNINSGHVFERAVLETARNTRGGFGGIWSYYYNDEKYTIPGIPEDEFTYILSYFNKAYLSDEKLNKLLGKYSQEDMKRFTHILEPLISSVDRSKTTNDWSGLIIDDKIVNQLTNIEKAYLEARYNGNPEPLRSLLINNDCNDPFVEYYLGFAGGILRNKVSNPDEQIDKLSRSLYFDKMTESEDQAAIMYECVHGKQKTLE